MNSVMEGIKSCHSSPPILNKDFILNNEFPNLSLLQFDLASNSVLMSKISEICF
jgi:hypothetical protein